MKKAYTISSSVLIAIGAIHMFFGIAGATVFNSEILWFISTGLLLVTIGCVNLTMAIRNISGFKSTWNSNFQSIGSLFHCPIGNSRPDGSWFFSAFSANF